MPPTTLLHIDLRENKEKCSIYSELNASYETYTQRTT